MIIVLVVSIMSVPAGILGIRYIAMLFRSVIKLIALFLILLTVIPVNNGLLLAFAQDEDFPPPEDYFSHFSDTDEPDGLPWNISIVATHYGGGHTNCWGGYGNRLYPDTDYFVALPANTDSLPALGGVLGCRESRCGVAQPTLDELLNSDPVEELENGDNFEFWPGGGSSLGEQYGWVIEGDEGDGYFRVVEIKPSGQDWPVFEAYVGDVGPWCIDDPYWEEFNRPNAEDGVDTRGRMTNRAGIDCSWALAQALGFGGIMDVDWRWKTIDGAYVIARRPTEWRW